MTEARLHRNHLVSLLARPILVRFRRCLSRVSVCSGESRSALVQKYRQNPATLLEGHCFRGFQPSDGPHFLGSAMVDLLLGQW